MFNNSIEECRGNKILAKLLNIDKLTLNQNIHLNYLKFNYFQGEIDFSNLSCYINDTQLFIYMKRIMFYFEFKLFSKSNEAK